MKTLCSPMGFYMFQLDCFYENFIAGIESIISSCCDKITETANIIISYITSTNLAVTAFKTVLWCSKQINLITDKCNQIYETNPTVKKSVDHFVYFLKFAKATIINQQIEPFRTDWICTSFLSIKNPQLYINNSFSYVSMYDFIKNDNPIDNSIYIDNYIDMCKSANIICLNTKNMNESMVTMKIDNQYINNIFPKNGEHVFELSLPLMPCKFQFLSIKYSHKYMSNDIYIDIDKNYYCDKNEILSPLFIKKYLEHQPINYHFDMDYTIDIIDNDVTTFSLKNNQHILLYESTYVVVNNDQ